MLAPPTPLPRRPSAPPTAHPAGLPRPPAPHRRPGRHVAAPPHWGGAVCSRRHRCARLVATGKSAHVPQLFAPTALAATFDRSLRSCRRRLLKLFARLAVPSAPRASAAPWRPGSSCSGSHQWPQGPPADLPTTLEQLLRPPPCVKGKPRRRSPACCSCVQGRGRIQVVSCGTVERACCCRDRHMWLLCSTSRKRRRHPKLSRQLRKRTEVAHGGNGRAIERI